MEVETRNRGSLANHLAGRARVLVEIRRGEIVRVLVEEERGKIVKVLVKKGKGRVVGVRAMIKRRALLIERRSILIGREALVINQIALRRDQLSLEVKVKIARKTKDITKSIRRIREENTVVTLNTPKRSATPEKAVPNPTVVTVANRVTVQRTLKNPQSNVPSQS